MSICSFGQDKPESHREVTFHLWNLVSQKGCIVPSYDTTRERMIRQHVHGSDSVDGRIPAPLGNNGKSLFVGIYIILGFLRWCEMDFVHPQLQIVSRQNEHQSTGATWGECGLVQTNGLTDLQPSGLRGLELWSCSICFFVFSSFNPSKTARRITCL